MKFHVLRVAEDPLSRLGEVYVNEAYCCLMVEPRDPACPECDIPVGAYELRLMPVGPTHAVYKNSALLKGLAAHRGLLAITGIGDDLRRVISFGRVEEDCMASPVVGIERYVYDPALGYRVNRNAEAYRLFYGEAASALIKGRRVEIEFGDRDRGFSGRPDLGPPVYGGAPVYGGRPDYGGALDRQEPVEPRSAKGEE